MNTAMWVTDRAGRFAFGIVAAFLLFISSSAFGQVASTADSIIFATTIAKAKDAGIDKLPIGERVAQMGEIFLDAPYVAHTLDSDATNEHVVIDLRGFDCVTFYENALALARILKEYPKPVIENLRDELKFLRYRNGKLDGFHSRLNYTIDYFYNAGLKKVLRDMTYTIGGKNVKYDNRTINFMTTHRALYSQLANNDAEFSAMQKVEKEMRSQKNFYYISKSDVSDIESKIETGDILGIRTDIDGLDCSHTGIAIRMPDGRIHFLHASSVMGKVIVSQEPLSDYLGHNPHQTGIMIERPLETAPYKPSQN
jgi:hypothetical protein